MFLADNIKKDKGIINHQWSIINYQRLLISD